jgi:hypothetical protein
MREKTWASGTECLASSAGLAGSRGGCWNAAALLLDEDVLMSDRVPAGIFLARGSSWRRHGLWEEAMAFGSRRGEEERKGEWRRWQEGVGELGLQVWWILRSRRSWRIR